MIKVFAPDHPASYTLAGGLRPDNVAEAIRRVRPWGVDVATGVEASGGRKDPDALVLLVTNARRTHEL